MFPKLSSILLVAVTSVIVAGPAQAHVRITTLSGHSPRWARMPIPYAVNMAGAGIPNGSEFLAVQAAFRTWEEVEGAAVHFEYTGTTPSRSVGLDGANLVTFTDDGGLLGSTTLAATFSFFQGSGANLSFREADIAFNPAFNLTTSGEAGAFDIQGIVLHESGHLLGLDHTGIVSSVMSPYAAPDQTDQRLLQYDDVSGIREIYPDTTGGITRSTGTIRGTVSLNGVPVRGGHVVALTEDGGRALVSTLTAAAGTYALTVPPGGYHVYVEALDGPVAADHVPRFFGPIDTSFAPTFFGGTASLTAAATVLVEAGGDQSGIDIPVTAKGTSGLNLSAPSFAVRIPAGTSRELAVAGEGVVAGTTFSASSPEISFGTPVFGGGASAAAPTSAAVPVTVPATTSPGPRTVLAVSGDTASGISGGIVVTNPPPSIFEVFPPSGPIEGGTVVQIRADGAEAGTRVFFAGMPATDVGLLDGGFIEATTPENTPGSANVQLFNPDGTSGLLRGGFRYAAPPPAITSVAPATGPPSTLVIIDGENFDVRPRNIRVHFNGQPARVIDSTPSRIRTVVPFGATTGLLTVSVFGTEASAGTFEVTPATPSANRAPMATESIDATPFGPGSDIAFASNDDGIFFMSLPFTFSLFTDTFVDGERISITTNGWISLDGASSPEYQNTSLPAINTKRPSGSTGSVAPAMLAPFFDDLTFERGGRVRTLVTGAAPNRSFVVQWDGASILDEAGNDLGADLTFRLVLYEGSNDVRFIYDAVTGARSDGSSATVGMQNLDRNAAVQSGFNQPIIASGKAITYYFDDGRYEVASTPPAPTVTDGGKVTASRTQLIASWVTSGPGEAATAFDYAIGTTPGGTDIRGFTHVAANSVVASGLRLEAGATYYFAVRGKNSSGTSGAVGVSDGIRVDVSFKPTRSVFPFPAAGAGFAGFALVAEDGADVVFRAVDPDGGLRSGLGIRNPTTVTLDAGEQFSGLLGDVFGLSGFSGWVELESSEPTLRALTSSGAADLSVLDATGRSPVLKEFLLLHTEGFAVLVNPGESETTVTTTRLETGTTETIAIGARERSMIALEGGPIRVSSETPVAALEVLTAGGKLAFGSPVSVPQRSLVFPHAVVGQGFRSWVTFANTGAAGGQAIVEFGDSTASIFIPGRSSIRFSVAELLGISDTGIRTGAVRIRLTSPFAGASLVGAIDIESESIRVTLAAGPPVNDAWFPHVADADGVFTGIAMAADGDGATVSIDVFTTAGRLSRTATVVLEPDGQRARLLREFVPGSSRRSDGYIRLRSDRPIWAWEIFGTPEAMASGPPL